MNCYDRVPKREWKAMTMIGVGPHPRTRMLWLRLRTPAHLINRRKELEALGVKFSVEHHRSLGTRNRREAQAAYAAKRHEIQEIWSSWEALLAVGPRSLSAKNIAALAGAHAKAFFETHEEDPFDAPHKGLEGLVTQVDLDAEAVAELLDRLSPDVRREYAEYMSHLATLNGEQLLERLWESLERYPFQRKLLRPLIVDALERRYGAETDAILTSKRLNVTAHARESLGWELHRLTGIAIRALERRAAGDWRPIEELEYVPSYTPPPPVSEPPKPPHSPSGSKELTFESVIQKQEEMSRKDLEKQAKAIRTVSGYRTNIKSFAAWRGSNSVATVTKSEIAKWRDSMIDEGILNAKTIRNKLGSVSAVISWAIDENTKMRFDDPSIPELFPNGNPGLGIDKPIWHKKESELLTHSEELAKAILYAARKEEDPKYRWIPFLEAYHGMRIGEIVQLEKSDLMSYRGFYYLFIRSNQIRKTKTRKGRRVPVHKAVVAEGFVDFVKAAPEGRLFPGSKTATLLAEWIREVASAAGGLGEDAAPNHGFRHLFEDLATGHLEFAAQAYIAGRALPNSAEDYGKSPAMIPKLSKMLNKIPSIIPAPAN